VSRRFETFEQGDVRNLVRKGSNSGNYPDALDLSKMTLFDQPERPASPN
jgi:hypothetical protein